MKKKFGFFVFVSIMILVTACQSSTPPSQPQVQNTVTIIPTSPPQTLPTATSLPPLRVTVFCGYFKMSPQTVAADQPVVLFWNWQTLGESYRQDYINNVKFSLTVDGKSLDISQAGLDLSNDEKGFYAVWHMPATILPLGTHEVVLTEELVNAISDGADTNKDGKLDTYGPGTTQYPPCSIIVK